MGILSTIYTRIREAIGRMIPYKSIEQAERIDTPLTTEMVNAVEKWYAMYLDQPPWVDRDSTQSMNLPAFISGEIARHIVLEMKWSITGKGKGEDGEEVMNPRAEFLAREFSKLADGITLRTKLEQGCAAGGMVIKPYPDVEKKTIGFDWAMDWGFYPIAFDDDGNLTDFIIPDVFREGKTIYTRLERHRVLRGGEEGIGEEAGKKGILITQRAFKSTMEESLGREISLQDVPRWEGLQERALITETETPLIGWYKVASANTIDVDSPLGASVYAKAADVIKQADLQYSRILWEYEASEMAIDVDPTALRPKKTESGTMEMPKLNKRLFRAVDIDKGDRDLYEVFAPQIRDSSLFHGLNQLLMRVEYLCGLSFGTISEANTVARTATELKIVRTRSFTTISDNQKALEKCLRDVIAAMDRYATIYKMAPEGEYDVSFEWDDSIMTDTEQQTQERLMLLNAGLMSKAEFREWYFGETKAQAEAAITAITQEKTEEMQEMMMPGMSDALVSAQDGAGAISDADGGSAQGNAQNAP